MAAAASPFTVHIKNMAGDIISIDGMKSTTFVRDLKYYICHKIKMVHPSIHSIILTQMDQSPKGFTVLENERRLIDYDISDDHNELNLVVNSVIVPYREVNELFYQFLDDTTNLSPVPENARVVHQLQPNMAGKIIYVVPPHSENGLECQIVNVLVVPNLLVCVKVVQKDYIFNFGNFSNPIRTALQEGRIYLLDDSVKGGRRRKRSLQSKRKLLKKRRTRRNY
jgi:hypothetical protein